MLPTLLLRASSLHMKGSTLLAVLLFYSIQIAWTQMAYLQPTGAGPDDPVTLFFDASQGNRELEGAAKVYVHHGVVTDGPDGTSWQYVKGNWGQDDGIGEMQKVTGQDNLWSIELTPSIRSYFGVPAGENIFRISCVFRSADGNVKGTQAPGEYGWGRVTSNLDNYLDLNVEAFIDITSPGGNELFAEAGSSFSISARASSQASRIELSIDRGAGPELMSSANNSSTISYSYPVDSSVALQISVTATINGTEVTAERQVFVTARSAVQNRAVPADARLGINYSSDPTEATLVLEAPGKEFVYLIGDFNDWRADDRYQMYKDGDRFWINIDGLEPGREYVFQYWIDGEIKVGDSYADKVADPWNDRFIEPEVYPNLPAYDRTENNLATVLQTNQQPYVWSSSEASWQRPDVNHLVIYELHIRDFLQSHNYVDLIDTLDYIKRLGVNAIELMPVNEFEGNDSWGYNPSYFFAVDKYYGTKDQLKAFIDACHQKGLAVITDLVLNHAFGQNPMVRMYFEDGNPSADNPWFNREYVGQYQWGYDFNHESPYTKAFVDSVNRYWLEEFHFDGIRFDFTKGFTNFAPGGSVDGYDASRIALLKRMVDKIRVYDPEAYIILEHWGPANEEQELGNYGMKMWRNRSYDYVPAAIGRTNTSLQGMDALTHVSYFNSHDERRLSEHILNEGLQEGAYDTRLHEIMYERTKLAAAFTFLQPGPKMLWQFDELGYDIHIDFNGRTGRKPYPWGQGGLGYYEDSLRQHIYDLYAGILDIRNRINPEALYRAQKNHQLSGDVRRLSFNTDSIDLLVLGNFSLSPMSTSPKFPGTGMWYAYFQGDSILVTNPDNAIELAPGELRIYTNRRLSAPKPAVLQAFENPVSITPYPFSLDDEITITFDPAKGTKDGTAGLEDAESVFMHSGLAADAYGTNWFSTVGTLQPSGPGQMTRSSDGRTWTMTLVPRTYFNLGDDATALRLGMFFHDGSNVNRTKGFRNQDIYYPIQSSEPLLTVSPYPFKADERVTITYNAAKGNRELLNADKVYMHSGTTTVAAETPQDAWTIVVGNWGQDDGIGQMQRVANSQQWQISFVPKDYYNLEDGQHPHWIGMVFRNANGSAKGTAEPGTY